MIQNILYIGLNGKDTNKQEIAIEEAKQIIKDVCVQYVDGYTILEVNGMWTDNDSNVVKENMIVCYFYDTDEQAVHSIASDLITILNQNCILIETNNKTEEYYYAN